MAYIGIDLGTTYSRVAVVVNGKPAIIPSDYDGKNIVPSVVAYSEKEILVGNPAVICNTDLSNILYDSKRLIGWHIVNNLPNAEDRQLWTFNVDTRNNCAGYVLNKGTTNEKFLKPEEVSAEILKYLKKYAEKYLSEEVTGCVVTVPAIFAEQQLSATKRAIEMADLNLIELLNEPTAAAIAYNQKNNLGNSTILLFDWGGSTLDVTIAEMKNEELSIKAVSGEPYLGGQDIDARIMKFVNEESKKSYKCDIFKKANLIKQLRRSCREAKETLSFKINSCNIQMYIGERELNVELSKEKLHDLCRDIFERAMNLVDQALNTARMNENSIDHVILVGGTTRMPIIQQKLSEKFGKSKLKFDINPDEAVALGAAIYANYMESNNPLLDIRNLSINDTKSPDIPNYSDNKATATTSYHQNGTTSEYNEIYIGIDLGTTYSCVAVVENGKPTAIRSDHGENIVPSVVAYDGNKILVGNSALDCDIDMANILYDSKRLIGWHILHDLPIAEDRSLWTFNATTENNCAGYLLYKGTPNEKFIKPEEVSAEILKYLKYMAEEYLSKKISGAIVTIPALFSSHQITATKKAIELAGLELKSLLREPTAAVIAYNQKAKLGNCKLFCFDFGGGTLDVSIAEMKNGQLKIIAVAGDPHLGGQDFDSRIMKYVITEFQKASNYDIHKKPKLVKRLRTECRKGKEALSSTENPINIHLDTNDDLELNVELTRSKLVELCKDLFDKALSYVDRALNMPKISPEQIDHVILVGGSSRIPFIQEKMSEKFGRSKVKFNYINPDYAVVFGAAIYASSMQIFYLLYGENPNVEGRICFFNSSTFEVEIVGKFSNWAYPYEVTTGYDQTFLIRGFSKVFEIFNYETKQFTKGPDPPKWRQSATAAYYKNKLYYIGGLGSNCVNILVNGIWQREPNFPIEVKLASQVICNDKLYIISENSVFQLSDDEREWIEVGKMNGDRWSPAVASLNGKIYITGGSDNSDVSNSCFCFDTFDERFTTIANMNYKREDHSLVVANGNIYAIGGYQENNSNKFCKSVEEYDPTTDSWRKLSVVATKNQKRCFILYDIALILTDANRYVY